MKKTLFIKQVILLLFITCCSTSTFAAVGDIVQLVVLVSPKTITHHAQITATSSNTNVCEVEKDGNLDVSGEYEEQRFKLKIVGEGECTITIMVNKDNYISQEYKVKVKSTDNIVQITVPFRLRLISKSFLERIWEFFIPEKEIPYRKESDTFIPLYDQVII